MLNDAKMSHDEVCTFGSEPSRLFYLALHTVFHKVFFNTLVTLTSMHAGLPIIGMQGHASSVHTVL